MRYRRHTVRNARISGQPKSELVAGHLPEQCHGCSIASNNRYVLAPRMLLWMALYCHDSILSAADTESNKQSRLNVL